MAKQLALQKYIYKIHSSRLSRDNWDVTIPLTEARKNDEIISLADSLLLRWLDELNGLRDAEERARDIRAQIRQIRKEPVSLQNRHKISKLYADLDKVQFKPDYMCLIIDREKDYHRACKGFKINGISYHRLLGTNGGVKNSTIVFISDRHGDEIRRRIENGRNPEKELIASKLEAYKALTCSASIPVSMPHGILVVNDCNTSFLSDVIYIDDEQDGEPIMEERKNAEIALDESDGYGMMLPSLARRWGMELGLDYMPGGVNTRFAWEKGMVFCFDFLEFADRVSHRYMVTDAWGNQKDIRDVELILTTSMLKLWDSYDSCEEYLRFCMENKYQFGITKVCPKELESERNLNYQFIQSYHLNDDDIEELIAPTIDEIQDILGADIQKTILYLKGTGLTDKNIDKTDNDFVKALMIEPEMIHDPYIRSQIRRLIHNRINESKTGVIKVHGNYSVASGDPYALCQSIFGMEVTGILKGGEIYNKYWIECQTERVACFRAPMTCHNNCLSLSLNHSEKAAHWYRYMNTCTVFNAWDTSAIALNGMDKDGDLVMLTDNPILVNKMRDVDALVCVQRAAQKKVVTEEDLIASNIASFGDEIGKITNRVTSMYDIQAQYPEDSREYKELDYRICCGQHYQQCSIDKTKGIIAKPMPKEWYDWHYAVKIEDCEKRDLYLSILADKKPYFMRYIYPDLMRRYNKYIRDTNKKSFREFRMSVKDLRELPEDKRTERQGEFLRNYRIHLPVSDHDCVVNRICKRLENTFDGRSQPRQSDRQFDYRIMKSGAEYTDLQYRNIQDLYNEYNQRVREYAIVSNRERMDKDEISSCMALMRQDFRVACDVICPNAQTLCDILLDMCYAKEHSRQLVWDLCGEEIIQNLLEKKGHYITYPLLDPDGDVSYKNNKFTFHRKKLEDSHEHHIKRTGMGGNGSQES